MSLKTSANLAIEDSGALALALDKLERKLYTFDVNGFFGLGDQPIHKIGIWVNTKEEQDTSIISAHRRIESETSGATLARSDADLLTDAKTIEILFRACRRFDDPRYPAFPGPEWMRKKLTTGHLATLLNLYNEVVQREGPVVWELDDEKVEAIATVCANTGGSDVPEGLLANCPRELLSHVVVLLSCKLAEARSATSPHG